MTSEVLDAIIEAVKASTPKYPEENYLDRLGHAFLLAVDAYKPEKPAN